MKRVDGRPEAFKLVDKRYQFCSACGVAYPTVLENTFPKKCRNCGLELWANPGPVAVVILPTYDIGDTGILLVRRGIMPCKGELALPGGFAEIGETVEEAGAREVLEETGIEISPNLLKVVGVEANPSRLLYLVFLLYTGNKSASIINEFIPNHETEEVRIGRQGETLCFPWHQKYFDRFVRP